jgi:catechol 2,3-dioxygenase-like lactoylglutathione lyase family enzyme
MEQRLSLVTLGVADLERARRFYEDGLGWRHSGDGQGVYFFQSPGTVVALWGRADLAADAGMASAGAEAASDDIPGGAARFSGRFSGMALAHNVASPAAVDAVLAEAKAAGAKILKPAAETFWGGYSGYFADPDGHVWEVAHNPFWSFDADGGIRLPA